MEHLASNLEQIGTGKGAVLQRRISVEQLQQRGTVWNRIGTFHLTEGTNRNIKNNILEQLQQRGTVWNRIGTFHLIEGTNRNIKNNVLEHLASNLE